MKRISIGNAQAIEEAVHTLSSGGIIVYPTDTLYGFGVDATNDLAINRLNKIKGRRGPMSVMAPDIETAIEWMNISIEQRDMVPFYLGGEKTLIAPVQSDIVSSLILGDNHSLGIRIPEHTFCV